MAGLSLTAHAACFLPYVCTRPAVFVVPLEGTKEAAVTFTLYDQNTEQPEHKGLELHTCRGARRLWVSQAHFARQPECPPRLPGWRHTVHAHQCACAGVAGAAGPPAAALQARTGCLAADGRAAAAGNWRVPCCAACSLLPCSCMQQAYADLRAASISPFALALCAAAARTMRSVFAASRFCPAGSQPSARNLVLRMFASAVGQHTINAMCQNSASRAALGDVAAAVVAAAAAQAL